MELKVLIESSERAIQWLDRQIDNLRIPSDLRSRAAAGALDAAMEHQKAIVLLVAQKLPAPAFSLARVLYEAYVRGAWLHRAASGPDLDRFLADKLDKRFGLILDELESSEGFEARTLSSVKSKSWHVMNSFTHTGFGQVVRRQTQTTIEPNYEMPELIEVINFASAFGFLAAMEIALLADDTALAARLLERVKSEWGKN